MKATQIRATLGLVAPAVAAVLGLGAHSAFAGVCANPAGASFTARTSRVTFTINGSTVTCTGSSTSGVVPSSPDNCNTNTDGEVCGDVSNPTFTGCTGPFGVGATITANNTNGNWRFCAKHVDSANTFWGILRIPQGGVKATIPSFGCSASGPNTADLISGPFTNGTPSTVAFGTSSNSNNDNSVSVTTSGGFPCPSGTSATISATYTVTTSTGGTVTLTP